MHASLSLPEIVQVVLRLVELALRNPVVSLSGPGLFGRRVDTIRHVKILVPLLEPLLIQVACRLSRTHLVEVKGQSVHARNAVVTRLKKVRVRSLVVTRQCRHQNLSKTLLLTRLVIHQLHFC